MPILTPSAFLELHPEFEGASDAMITQALVDAESMVNADMFLETTNQAIRLLACHNLALSPAGQAARMVNDSGSTTYYTQYEKLVKVSAIGYRVL